MAVQLIGTYDGSQEAPGGLRTRRRAAVGGTLDGIVDRSFAALPGAGVNPAVLIGVGLVGMIAGVWIGRRWRR